MSYTSKVYHFWQERNIDSKVYMKLPTMIKKATQISGDTMINQQIGVDGSLDNDRQEGMEYD